MRLTSVLACVHVLLVTRCRAAWVALAVVLVLTLAVQCWRASRWGTSGLAAFAGAALAWLPNRLEFHEGIHATAQRVLEHSQGSGAGRIEQAKVAFVLWRERPLLGFGLGGWNRELGRRPPLKALFTDGGGYTPNSDLIRSFVEGGLVLGLLVLALLLLFAHVWPSASSSRRYRPALRDRRSLGWWPGALLWLCVTACLREAWPHGHRIAFFA